MPKATQHILYQENYQKEAQDYRNYMITLGYSYQTQNSRYLFLKEFFAFLESLGIYQLQHITAVEIVAFQEYLNFKRNPKTGEFIKKSSVYERMRLIQMYLGYVQDLGKIKMNPSSHLKFVFVNDKSERIIFSQSQITELIKASKTAQERALIMIAYGCGLRVSELVALREDDIRLSENVLIVQKGKNNKRRLIPITDKLRDEIQAYLQREDKPKVNFKELFINNANTPMQHNTANTYFKKLLKRTAFGCDFTKVQLNLIGIHTLRHSIATHLIENGMKLEQVQIFLGHSYIESTEIYTHISQKQLNDIIR
jgi:integrase/recombinase XerD